MLFAVQDLQRTANPAICERFLSWTAPVAACGRGDAIHVRMMSLPPAAYRMLHVLAALQVDRASSQWCHCARLAVRATCLPNQNDMHW